MTSTTDLYLTLTQQPALSMETLSLLGEYYGYEEAIKGVLGQGPESRLLDNSSSNTDNTVFLWDMGCIVNGTKNCPVACSIFGEGPNLVWSSPDAMFTLHNCLLCPILATAAVHEWLVEDPPGLLHNFSIHPSINSSDLLPANPTEGAFIPSAWFVILQHDLCWMGDFAPNADLAGPGITISCIQQIVILVAIWLFLSVIPLLQSGLDALRRRTHASTVHRTRIHAAYDKQAAFLLITLREFQKTQTFFCIALQIGVLLALNNPTWFDAPTIWQLITSVTMVASISAAGVYPIVIGLVVLRKIKGSLEWFLLATSIACVAVSTATWYRIVHMRLSRSALRQASYDPMECGHINPIQHCLPSADESVSIRGVAPDLDIVQWTAAAPLFMAFVLAVEKLYPAEKWRLPAWLSSSGNIFNMILLCGMWVDKDYDGKVWTVGQVIAAGIFIPVFLEWVFLVMCGVEASFSIRLPDVYKIVTADADNSSSDPSATTPTITSRDSDQRSSGTLSIYELLPSPYGDTRIPHAHMWSPT